MPITGDWKKLEQLIKRTQTIADPGFMRALSADMAEETLSLIRQGFANESDPYGRPWQQLKRRQGRILQDTGRLRNSFHYSLTPGGFRVANATVYARAHQDPQPRSGWGKRPGSLSQLPQRMMVPSKTLGLPPRYVQAYTGIVKDHLRAHMKR